MNPDQIQAINHNKITWHIFIQFLAQHDALNGWLDNMLNNCGNHDHVVDDHVNDLSDNMEELIGTAFGWSGTPERGGYWSDVSINWYKIHNKINVTLAVEKLDNTGNMFANINEIHSFTTVDLSDWDTSDCASFSETFLNTPETP